MQNVLVSSEVRGESEPSGTAESVEALIARQLRIPEASVTDELEYQAITEWDSLAHVGLMLALEEAYGQEIDADLMLELTSVAAIRAFAQRRGAGQPSVAPQEAEKATAAEDGRDKVQVHRGLAGVVFDRTHTTLIDGQNGRLLYRGYSIHDLAERSTFEETTYLLLHGELPTSAELAAFDEALKAARAVPPAVVDIIRSVQAAHPTDVLRTAVSAMAAFDGERPDGSAEALQRWAIRLTAQVPTLVATHQAIRRSRDPIAPSPTLSHAANFLYMLTGEVPTERTARLLDQDLILHADHGSNASAFAARVVAGTQADPYGALTAAIATFAGPLHGGAVESVMRMVQEVGEPERAAGYVAERLARHEPVMGFGHRVYRTEDPRARHLRRAARELSEDMGEPKWYAILENIVAAMRPYAQKGMDVNVDFYAGVIYQLLGIPQDLSVPVFVAGRMPGWIAQIQEQYENNILIRPLLQYVGAPSREYRPSSAR